MVLTKEQAKLFYDLWIPLLDFVNRKYKLRKDFYGMDSPKGLPLDVVRIISGKLWEDTSVIDEYLSKNYHAMRMEVFIGFEGYIPAGENYWEHYRCLRL